jgi:hypothetical protein
MANRLMTLDEVAADFSKLMSDFDIDPKEFVLALAYAAASAQDENEERQVRVILGLED